MTTNASILGLDLSLLGKPAASADVTVGSVGAVNNSLVSVGVTLAGVGAPTASTPPTPANTSLLGVDVTLGGGGSAPPVSTGAAVSVPPAVTVGVGLGLGGLTVGAGLGVGSGGAATGGSSGSPTVGIGVDVGVGVGAGSGGGISVGVGGGSGGGISVGVGTGTGAGTGTGGSGTGGSGAGTGTGGSTGGGSTGGAAGTDVPDPHTAFVNIFRLENASQIPSTVDTQLRALEARIAAGEITPTQGVLAVVDAAVGFTAVAEVSYQFFTGLTPTAAGLTYLVHSGSNPTDLSDTYYDPFNLENRYINFASNLGLHSDAAPEFAQVYGAMSFEAAVGTAYERIVGRSNAAAAGINADAAIADISGRRGYFEAVAHERFGNDNFDLSTKLAAIAYLMQEAVRAEAGSYGQATQNFLFDLADGQARFNIDLVGVYGPGTPFDVV